jgi:Tfp pilus assembly protein, pilus retraction ATPase PilT
VILVGELRDLETIRLALTAAETGHLVFATLHTASAAKSVDRIIDVFPGSDKPLVRSMLSSSLRAVISQQLVKSTQGQRVAAYEIMTVTSAVCNLIREDRVAQIASMMQTGTAHGMQTMAQAMAQLEKQGVIAPQAAISPS